MVALKCFKNRIYETFGFLSVWDEDEGEEVGEYRSE